MMQYGMILLGVVIWQRYQMKEKLLIILELV